jgi:lysozyme
MADKKQQETSMADLIVGQATATPSASSTRRGSQSLMSRGESYTIEEVQNDIQSYVNMFLDTQRSTRQPVDATEVQDYLDSVEGPPLDDSDINMTGDLASLVVQFEGFEPKAYWDVKQWSIGHGTKASGEGATITPEQAKAELAKELASARREVINHAKKHGYDWSDNQIDALASFTYNAGAKNLRLLTDNGRRGDETISEKILEYNKSDGKVLDGLTKRRQVEARLFTQGYD